MNRFLFASVSSIVLSQAVVVHAGNYAYSDDHAADTSKRIHVQLFDPDSKPELVASQLAAETTSKGQVGLTDQQNTQYYGAFMIGSNQQKFTGILDTGSSNVWIPDKSCSSQACLEKAKFDSSASSTFQTNNEPLSIQYGTGSLQGSVGYDTVTFGGMSVSDQGFGLAQELSNDFLNSPFDGIFGLAYRSIASDQVTPWLDNAVAQGLLPKAMFSFYLSNTPADGTGRLILGDPDPDYYQGDITWHSLEPLETGGPVDFYYNIVFDGIGVDSTSIPLTCQYEGTCHAIVDSGTSLIVGPAQDIANIQNTLNLNPDCSNLDDQPDLVFNIGGIEYAVPPRFYVVKQMDWWGEEQCVAGLSQGGEDFWIFGDAFMRGFYVIFDKTDSKVGLASLADSLNNPQSLRVLPPAQKQKHKRHRKHHRKNKHPRD